MLGWGQFLKKLAIAALGGVVGIVLAVMLFMAYDFFTH